MINPGDVVQDNARREGIALWPEKPPRQHWLNLQKDERLKSIHSKNWWCIAQRSGGATLCPAELMAFVRKGSVRDALPIASTDLSIYTALSRVFPEIKDLLAPPLK